MKPNILFIIADQFRWDALSRFGWVDTPALDALARDGIDFTNCFSNAPVCKPARVSLAVGRYPHEVGLQKNEKTSFPPDMETWMSSVRAAGYRTGLFGKAHLAVETGETDIRKREGEMRAMGFDVVDEIVGPRGCRNTQSHMTALWQQRGVWDEFKRDYAERFATKPYMARPSPLPLDLYMDVYVVERAREYLTHHADPLPWCITVGFGGPHEPWDAPEPYASRYAPRQMPAPRPAPGNVDWMPDCELKQRFLKTRNLSAQDVAEMRANYAGNVALIDAKIADLVADLKATGAYDDTWIVFTSDHGEMNGDFGLIYKNCFFDAAVRVPLIVKPPKSLTLRTGRASDALVELQDVGATLIEAAGAVQPSSNHSRSLLPVLRAEAASHRRFVVSEFKGERMLFDGHWKAGFTPGGECFLLVDAIEDPAELRNLAREPSSRGPIEQLRSMLGAWKSAAP